MSIEYAANIGQELPGNAIAALKAFVLDHAPYKIGRESGTEFGLVKAVRNSDQSNPELITFSIDKGRVYVAFHACNRSDREAFLGVLKNGLEKEGATADFEEL